jgi:hypothetical protein
VTVQIGIPHNPWRRLLDEYGNHAFADQLDDLVRPTRAKRISESTIRPIDPSISRIRIGK